MFTHIKKRLLFAVTFAAVACSSQSFAASTIDVLVVYTQGSVDLYGADPTTRFNQVFQVTNQIYKDSNVDVQVRLAKAVKVDYTDDNNAETALNDITNARVAAFTQIETIRAEAKADMVVFYRPYKQSHGSCGLAWVGGSANGDFSNPQWKRYMYAHVGISSCGDYVTAHELGHNMGLKHSRKQDGSGGVFPYALGYGVDNKFTTIMAYQSSFNVDYWSGKLYKFSNPELACMGVPCGVDRNDPTNGADAHYALNITTPQIAKFYDAPVTTSSSSSTASSASSKSSVASVAPKSSSSSSTSTVSPADLAAALAKVQVAKTALDQAQAALTANKALVEQRTKAEAAANAAYAKANGTATAAKSAAEAAAKKYNASVTALNELVKKVNAAAVDYQTATTTKKAAAAKTYNELLTAYNTARAQVTANYTAAVSAQNAAAAANSALAAALKVLNDAKQATTLAKAATTDLTNKVNAATSNYNAAVSAYNTLLAKSVGRK